MDIAGICSLIRILFIGIIIETSDFIGAVKHRDSGLGKHICVKHQILADTPFQLLVIFFKKSSLDPAHGSGSSAETGILSYRVIIIELSAAVASRMLSLFRNRRKAGMPYALQCNNHGYNLEQHCHS